MVFCLKWPSKNSLIHFYKRCVAMPMILIFLCTSNNALLTTFTYNVLGPLLRCWCMVICPKRLSQNTLIHFHKRCVLVSMILSFLCSSNNATLTPFTCNVLGLLSRWWCMVICLKWPIKLSLIHFYKRCVIVSMILSFLCSSISASMTPFTCRLISFLCSCTGAPLTSVYFTCNVLGC